MPLALVRQGLLPHGIVALRGSESAIGFWNGQRVIPSPNSLQVRGFTDLTQFVVGTTLTLGGWLTFLHGVEAFPYSLKTRHFSLIPLGAVTFGVGFTILYGDLHGGSSVPKRPSGSDTSS